MKKGDAASEGRASIRKQCVIVSEQRRLDHPPLQFRPVLVQSDREIHVGAVLQGHQSGPEIETDNPLPFTCLCKFLKRSSRLGQGGVVFQHSDETGQLMHAEGVGVQNRACEVAVRATSP